MEYEVTELAQAAGLSVDTIRYYQTHGLVPLPARAGRKAVYTEDHLGRLLLIRSMAAKGLSLKAIRMLLERDASQRSDIALLAALEEETDGPAYSSEDLARRLGVPLALIRSAEEAGLAEGQEAADGKRRYTDSDLNAARGAIRLLAHGFPLTKLLALAIRHDRAVRKTCDSAIDLFDDHVRKPRTDDSDDGEAVTKAFRELLPLVTAVVAHHFQRVLVNRALRRLKSKGDEPTLALALRVAARSKVRVTWQ